MRPFLSVFAVLCTLMAWPSTGRAQDDILDHLTVPEGFRISLFAEGVENARQLAQAEDGTVFAGSRKAGKLYALPDRDGDGVADDVIVLADDLTLPSGIIYHQGDLYVAALNRVLRFSDVLTQVAQRPAKAAGYDVIYDGFPTDPHHGWKYLDKDARGRLIVPVGVPCNICDAKEPFGTIVALDLNTKKTEVLARGVRNSVGFDVHPETGELWFTDNGRDWMGDTLPPEELNRVTMPGEHFGFPYFHGGTVPDPEYGTQSYLGKPVTPARFTLPAHTFPAHHAPLGMTFYQGKAFPEKYRHAIFVAEHGSWNRSERAGYQVSVVFLDDNSDVIGSEVFVQGWLQASWLGGRYSGRPADVFETRDGSLLIADDAGDRIYRVQYVGAGR